MRKAEFGIIGLGTMGRNLLLNISEKGYVGVGYDPDSSQREALSNAKESSSVFVSPSLDAFVSCLESPRRILIMVPSSQVDAVIDSLMNIIAEGDLVIDCGNSYYKDTERRSASLADRGVGFIGAGVSGGEKGARTGASIMVGGTPEHYRMVEGILSGASAKIESESCCALLGGRGSGHFVKMVHNGIEYALMESIAEAYKVLRDFHGISNREVADIFERWNDGILGSFLLEISSAILRKKDESTGQDLIDLISDVAGQKGTGVWTSMTAMEFGVAIPSIDAAVSVRQISGLQSLRTELQSRILEPGASGSGESHSIDDLESLLIVCFLASFSQGFDLIKHVSKEMGYGIDAVEVARIWRGGCIIRSKMLSEIGSALKEKPAHLFESDGILSMVARNLIGARRAVSDTIKKGLPMMTSLATISYIDTLTTANLPTNLIQAQRDLFGAHTYERKDREGRFHTKDWIE